MVQLEESSLKLKEKYVTGDIMQNNKKKFIIE